MRTVSVELIRDLVLALSDGMLFENVTDPKRVRQEERCPFLNVIHFARHGSFHWALRLSSIE